MKWKPAKAFRCVGFDLPRSVMLLRQGDPANAEKRLHDATRHARTPKPSDLAVDIGPRDCGWIPYADLQARLLVDLIERVAPQPLVLVGHLPGHMPAIALYSGDEDAAPLAATADQLNWLAQHSRADAFHAPTCRRLSRQPRHRAASESPGGARGPHCRSYQ